MTAKMIRLRTKNKCMQAELSVGRHLGESQRTEVAALQQRSQAVERLVGLHGSNSDEPSSSDWQRKPRHRGGTRAACAASASTRVGGPGTTR